MSIEIEAKLRCDDLDSVRRRLRELEAAPVGRTDEINIFLDSDDRALQSADKGLRLRINRNRADGSQTIVLTFKGPRMHGALKSRRETEVQVSDAETTAALFEQLGFARTLTFEKRRETWRLDECSIELDELPYIGSFVEVEGLSELAVLDVVQRLGLDGAPQLKTAYATMLDAYLSANGITDRVVKFP